MQLFTVKCDSFCDFRELIGCWCWFAALRQILNMLSHLAFTAAFGNTIYHLHFTEKEMGPGRL